MTDDQHPPTAPADAVVLGAGPPWEPPTELRDLTDAGHFVQPAVLGLGAGSARTQPRCAGTAPPVFANGRPLLCVLPAGHDGWHRDGDGAEWLPRGADGELREMPATALTAEQQIREKALAHAVVPYVGAYEIRGVETDSLAVMVLDLAARFEGYIRGPAEG